MKFITSGSNAPRTSRLIIFGLCLLGLSAIADGNDGKPAAIRGLTQYDKTIGDTRVVFLAISSVNILASTNSTSNEGDSTYIEISLLTEHVGTNSFKTISDAPATLYMKKEDGAASPLNPDSVVGIIESGSVCKDLPGLKIKVAGSKACHIRHVFLHGLHYPSSTRANCVVQDGFDGHLAEFHFNDILLPCSSLNGETQSQTK